MSLENQIRKLDMDIDTRKRMLARLGLVSIETDIESSDLYQDRLPGYQKLAQARPYPPAEYDREHYKINENAWQLIKPKADRFEAIHQPQAIAKTLDYIAALKDTNQLQIAADQPYLELQREYLEAMDLSASDPVAASTILSTATKTARIWRGKRPAILFEIFRRHMNPTMDYATTKEIMGRRAQIRELALDIDDSAQRAYDQLANNSQSELFVRSTNPASLLHFLKIGDAMPLMHYPYIVQPKESLA